MIDVEAPAASANNTAAPHLWRVTQFWPVWPMRVTVEWESSDAVPDAVSYTGMLSQANLVARQTNQTVLRTVHRVHVAGRLVPDADRG